MTSPVIRMLKQQTHATIHFLTKRRWLPLLQDNPHIDQLHILESSIVDELKKEQFDHIVDLHKNLRTFILRFQLKSEYLSFRKLTLQKWLYLFTGIDFLKGSHVVDRYIEGISSLNIQNDGKGLEIYTDTYYKLPIDAKHRKTITICMGGTYISKRVPFPLILPILADSVFRIILLGGNDLPHHPNLPHDVLNLIGKTSLRESISIIRQSDLIISGDTGMMHIAAALKKPLIVVWGSTSPIFGMYPYFGALSNMSYVSIENNELECRPCSKYGRKSCPKGHMNCLKALHSSQLIKEIDNILLS